MLDQPIDFFRSRVAQTTSGLFKHANYPLADTLDYAGDPGLCGPDSVSWRVIGDTSAFIGGVRALLVQAAHPEVAAGVSDHSSLPGRSAREAVADIRVRHRHHVWSDSRGRAGDRDGGPGASTGPR